MLNKTETAARELTDKELAQVTGGKVPADMTLGEYMLHRELQEPECKEAIYKFYAADGLFFGYENKAASYLKRPRGQRLWCSFCQSNLTCMNPLDGGFH